MTTNPAPRSRMSPERLGELYEAVLDLLLDVGYERLTLDAVAARAHSSKTTLYRQWDGKLGLVMAALRHNRTWDDDRARYGSLDEGLEAMAANAGRSVGVVSRLAFVLLQAASVDEEFAATLRETLLDPAVGRTVSLFEQAADRGEIERNPALFRQLAYTIVEHFVLLGLLDGAPDTVERRRAFFTSVIRPALTFGPPA